MGSSYLRTLNLEGLRELTGAVVVQDGEKPLVVVLPYETYLTVQEAIAMSRNEEPASQGSAIDTDGDEPFDQFKVEYDWEKE